MTRDPAAPAHWAVTRTEVEPSFAMKTVFAGLLVDPAGARRYAESSAALLAADRAEVIGLIRGGPQP